MTLTEQLERDEGNVPYAYQDSLGYWTIGIGFLVDKRKGGQLYPEEIGFILNNRVTLLRAHAMQAWDWFTDLDEIRQAVLLNMAYNMGIDGVSAFKHMIAYIEKQDFANAAKEMLDSKWASQVGDRAKRLAEQMETGTWQ